MITDTKRLFPQLSSCSFDKGFHSPDNQEKLAVVLEKVILPRKGKLDGKEAKIESEDVTAGDKRTRRSPVIGPAWSIFSLYPYFSL